MLSAEVLVVIIQTPGTALTLGGRALGTALAAALASLLTWRPLAWLFPALPGFLGAATLLLLISLAALLPAC